MLAFLCKDDTTIQKETMEGCIKIKEQGLPIEGVGTRQMWGKNWGKVLFLYTFLYFVI